jgi:hypothetical protein
MLGFDSLAIIIKEEMLMAYHNFAINLLEQLAYLDYASP